MIFDNYFIDYSPNLTINSISSYKNIMNKFIIKFIEKNKNNCNYKNNDNLYSDALIYSKYYLYWKTINCIYSDNIMDILYDIEFL